MSITNHVYPTTIEEVLSHLKEPNAKLLAGGTGLTLVSTTDISTLVDLQKTNLSYITDNGESILIGGTTSAYEIFRSELLPSSIRKAADFIGDLPLLHAVTIGGNFAVIYPWVDLPPMLYALNAKITLYDPDKKVLTSDEFMQYSNEKGVGNRNGLITEIEVPKSPENSISDYQSLTLIGNEKAQMNLASYFEWDTNGVITKTNLILSAATKFPRRLQAEQVILGNQLDDNLIQKAVDSVEEEKIVRYYKSSREYRREIVGVYLKRALKGCMEAMK